MSGIALVRHCYQAARYFAVRHSPALRPQGGEFGTIDLTCRCPIERMKDESRPLSYWLDIDGPDKKGRLDRNNADDGAGT